MNKKSIAITVIHNKALLMIINIWKLYVHSYIHTHIKSIHKNHASRCVFMHNKLIACLKSALHSRSLLVWAAVSTCILCDGFYFRRLLHSLLRYLLLFLLVLSIFVLQFVVSTYCVFYFSYVLQIVISTSCVLYFFWSLLFTVLYFDAFSSSRFLLRCSSLWFLHLAFSTSML